MFQKDPIHKDIEIIKKTINKCNTVIAEGGKHQLIRKNKLPAKLYGDIKLHKTNRPIRPVVSHIYAAHKKLSIKLNSIIKQQNYSSKYST